MALADLTPESVVATVDGTEITEGEVTAFIRGVWRQQTGGRPMPPQQFEAFRQRVHPQALDAVIDRALIENAAAEKEIVVTDEDLQARVDHEIALTCIAQEKTEAEFEELVKSNLDKTLEEYKNDTKADEDFKRYQLGMKLIRSMYPDEVTVTEDETRELYESQKEQRFTVPELVRASHILFGTKDPGADKDALRAQAEETLVEAKKADADFAALAQEHSSCPSKAKGGDLDFFPRNGAMVEPFAAAAWELEVDAVSDIVETDFGYHIIKVTERKEGRTRPLDEVELILREEIAQRKLGEKYEALVKELREKATIEKS